MMEQIYVGVDVAKLWLDIHHPARGARRIENTPTAIHTFARAVAKEGAWIVFEASGGYDRALQEGLVNHLRSEAASITKRYFTSLFSIRS